jgi:hypothetical protein
VTPDETAERAALLAKSQRYEKALRQIIVNRVEDVGPCDVPRTFKCMCSECVAREALAAAQEGDRT